MCIQFCCIYYTIQVVLEQMRGPVDEAIELEEIDEVRYLDLNVRKMTLLVDVADLVLLVRHRYLFSLFPFSR